MARIKVERNISFDEKRRRYYVHLDYGKDGDGDRKHCYKTFARLKDARKALRDFEKDLATGSIVLPQNITLGQWLEYWLREIITPNREAATVYGYRNIVENHIAPHLGAIRLQEIHPLHIQKYYTTLIEEQGLSSNTVRRHHDLLSGAFRMAVRQEVLRENPISRVEPPKTVQQAIPYYNANDLKRLYTLSEGTWLEIIIKLAGYLGLRRAEICGLRWKNVDFERRCILISEACTEVGGRIVKKGPKNRSSIRNLYITDGLLTALLKEKERQELNQDQLRENWYDSGFVAVNEVGKPYRPDFVSFGFSQLIEHNNLPKITLHGLRHTFATVASASGAPMFEISKTLGHSTPTTTSRIYTHLLDNTNAPTLNKVAEALE